MYAIAFTGYSGSGKTTLIEALIPLFKAAGQTVMVIKHAHHGFDMDHPGKDSYRHRVAGASAVLVASNQRSALLREYVHGEPTVYELIAQLPLQGDDERHLWVLIEGYRHSNLPKFEVCAQTDLHEPGRAEAATSTARPHKSGGGSRLQEDETICAIAAADAPGFAAAHAQLLRHRPVFDRNAVAPIAQWILDQRQQFLYALTGIL